ncbi:hypothetical protein K0M31_003838 [Melipona bicolor]|uniref:Uncharacterized protein n=1 Tax=Melipona bicolor TaxID=60889 RepID=A0AA40FY12_9HYME|nr:hypothetical protein K0M31_003838 [Melipona bicolor]
MKRKQKQRRERGVVWRGWQGCDKVKSTNYPALKRKKEKERERERERERIAKQSLSRQDGKEELGRSRGEARRIAVGMGQGKAHWRGTTPRPNDSGPNSSGLQLRAGGGAFTYRSNAVRSGLSRRRDCTNPLGRSGDHVRSEPSAGYRLCFGGPDRATGPRVSRIRAPLTDSVRRVSLPPRFRDSQIDASLSLTIAV